MKRSHIEIMERSNEYSVYSEALAAAQVVESEQEARRLAESWADILGKKGYDEVTVYIYREDASCSRLN